MTKELIKSTIYHIMSLLVEDTRFTFKSCPIKDSEYAIGLSTAPLEVILWGEYGRESLLHNNGFDYFKSDITPIVDEIFEVIEDKENGIMRCSDCGKKISVNEIAGHYFAGS